MPEKRKSLVGISQTLIKNGGGACLLYTSPKDDVVPDKAVLVVDGRELAEKTFTLDADEWAALPGTVPPCSIESAVRCV